ncbi:MAG: glycosyltransferase family 4 protein [Leptolyngbyaceae cyanobacterium SU_3_3]|nr:glycosyltransferase family 4 protein [Leptolyngbyaceae cyanobacterium SU_3_3]
MYFTLLLILLAGSTSLLTTDLVRRMFSLQLIDIPNDRSSHLQPTPRGGGLGFILGFILATGMALLLSPVVQSDLVNTSQAGLWLSLVPLIGIGILDDRGNVPARVRYLVQLSVSILVVVHCGAFPQPWLTALGNFGNLAAILLSVIGMTALINFYNFMDGLDGLVAGITAIQLGFLAFWFNQPLLWLLVAAICGFLYWNWSPAKIFMGDVGSTVLGASVALSLLNQAYDPLKAWSAITITLPIAADTIYTLIRRLLRKENIFQAHRSHLYQRLQQSGWSHSQVATVYMGVTLAIASLIGGYGGIGVGVSCLSVTLCILLGEVYLYKRYSLSQDPD